MPCLVWEKFYLTIGKSDNFVLKRDERVQKWLGSVLSRAVSRTSPSISIQNNNLDVDENSMFTVSVLSLQSKGEGNTISFGDSRKLHSKDKINLFNSAGELVLTFIYLREDAPQGILHDYDEYHMQFTTASINENPYTIDMYTK